MSFCVLVGSLAPDSTVAVYEVSLRGCTLCSQSPAFGPSPSFLALSPDSSTAYAANHDVPAPGLTAVAAATRTPLQPLVAVPDPCHVAVHPSGRWVLSASFSDGSVTVLPVLPGGLLGAPTTTALGRNAHQAALWGGGEEVLVPLLGSDAVAVLAFDAASGALALRQTLALPAGSGPRHIAFHPSNPSRAYLACELASSVVPLTRSAGGAWAAELGAAQSTLRPGLPVAAVQACAAIALAPDGAFLYVSNRAAPSPAGDNSIAVLALAADGALAGPPVSWAVGGEGSAALNFPRDFALSPDGALLVAASQRSGSLTVFTRSADTGALAFVSTDLVPAVASPSSVLFTRLAL